MCGIVGYVGHHSAVEFLLQGLRRLEYRGYDSAGLATLDFFRADAVNGNRLQIVKAVGRIEALAKKLKQLPAQGTIGIGHTRWATHGPPTLENAHPHLGGDGSIVLAHNGVIENYRQLKDRLEAEGYCFASQTDTEVIAHLLDSALRRMIPAMPDERDGEQNLLADETVLAVVNSVLGQLRGTYGLVILFRERPDLIVAARQGSPLVIGVGEGEHFVASDASPLAGHTQKIVYLADHQVALVKADLLQVLGRDQAIVPHSVQALAIGATDVELGGFPHYMLKEIFEQPESLENAMRGRLNDDDATAVFGGLNLTPRDLRQVQRIILTACGTSWHAALVGEHLLEELARIPVEVEYASELRYRNPPLDEGTLLFAITQSGETADTLAALREMKRKGHPTLAICNVVGSTIAQEAAGGIYLHAGPEIGVASTKAYTSQVMVLTLLALYFGRMRNMSYEAGQRIIAAIRRLPDQLRATLQMNNEVRRVAEKYCQATNFLYLGRQYNFPTALEGALKLKEISYLHAEGYPAAEMKHGPIALVDDTTPSVFIMPQGTVYDKVMSNLEEIKARGGPVIAVTTEGDDRVSQLADDVLYIPAVDDFLQPLLAIVPLQLLAYHIAVLRGCDVDKPRNLAKSVTVE
jgi:glutamine---fructose-6-phosphate transaminase (isomerizing)